MQARNNENPEQFKDGTTFGQCKARIRCDGVMEEDAITTRVRVIVRFRARVTVKVRARVMLNAPGLS